MISLTPAMLTVLREASDKWTRSYAHANTVEALERRGLIEAQWRGRFAMELYVRRTDRGRATLAEPANRPGG